MFELYLFFCRADLLHLKAGVSSEPPLALPQFLTWISTKIYRYRKNTAGHSCVYIGRFAPQCALRAHWALRAQWGATRPNARFARIGRLILLSVMHYHIYMMHHSKIIMHHSRIMINNTTMDPSLYWKFSQWEFSKCLNGKCLNENSQYV